MTSIAALARRLPILAAIGVLLAILVAGPVMGHAQLMGVDPPDGARLTVAPDDVLVTFNEPVALAPDGIRVLDAAGELQDDGAEVVTGGEIRQPVVALTDGWYVTSWAIVSEDGHILRGSTTFAVGDVTSAVDPEPMPMMGRAAAIVGPSRTLIDLGVLVATGAAAAWWLLRARSRWVLPLIAGATLVAIVASIDWMAIEWIDGGDAWLTTLAGAAAVLRLIVLGVALAAVRRAPQLSALALVIATLSLAVGGHTTGSELATLSEMVHLAAGALWLGAAPAVLVVLWDRDVDDAAALDVVRSFSRSAGLAIVAVGLAGVLLALQLTQGFADGVTDWTVVLVLKVGLVLLAVLLGAFGRRSLAGEPRRSRFRWFFIVDAAILVGVVILSASLTLRPPASSVPMDHTDEAAATPDGSSVAACAAPDRAEFVMLEADPGRSGVNDIEVRNLDDADSVSLQLAHPAIAAAPLAFELTREGDDWHAAAVAPFDGTWSATIVARLDSFTEARWTCRLVLAE